MSKKFAVCEELKYDGCYTIRLSSDCSSNRFRILNEFDSYEEAKEYIDYLKYPEEFFDEDKD